MMTAVPPLWWLGLVQFLICGLFAGTTLLALKTHKFPDSDRPMLYGIIITVSTLALFGLVIMAAA